MRIDWLNKKRYLRGAAALGVIVALYGCGSVLPAATSTSITAQTALPTATQAPLSEAATPTPWVPPTAVTDPLPPGAEATLTAAPAAFNLRRTTLTITNSKGENVNISVEIADTGPSQELGLMYRRTVPLDAGMLFDFGMDTTEGFWMANTILPLSIAFIRGDGTILDIHDMQALDRTTTSASGPYHYALETNQGYFRAHNIEPGNHVAIPGPQSAVVPGMPACSMK